jgi:hypothetical protein
MYPQCLLTLLLSLCCVSVTCIYLPQQLLQESHRDNHFEAAFIGLPLDHNNSTDNRTFSTRFWVNTNAEVQSSFTMLESAAFLTARQCCLRLPIR